MTLARWFTAYGHGSFPFECAALGRYDLSVLHIGGESQWLVRCDGHDVADGSESTETEAPYEVSRSRTR